jgi:hypothetical protein
MLKEWAFLNQIYDRNMDEIFTILVSKKKKCANFSKLLTRNIFNTSDCLPQTYLPDLQCWHMWKKVIANEKTQKDKIIYYPFKVNLKWRVGNLQIILQIFSQHPEVEELRRQRMISDIIRQTKYKEV